MRDTEEPVSPEHDEPTEDQEQELYEDVPPRSIFAATWFRVVLVVIVLGVIGAVAVPYVLDWMNPPPSRMADTRPAGSGTSLTPSVSDKPSSVPDKPPAERPAAENKAQDSALMPAPSAPAAPASPKAARPEAKSQPTPTPAPPTPAPPAKAAAESKSVAKPAPAKPAPPKVASVESPARTAAAVTESPAKPAATKTAAAKASAPTPTGPFWVQVGAFKDAETAKRLAGKLRDAHFNVDESIRPSAAGSPAAPVASKSASAPAASAASDQYDVHVTGTSIEELNKRLSSRGLAAQTSSSGVVVKPSLPLRDAVALSKDLAVDGLKVQVRRAGGAASAAASSASPAADSAPALHRVRVGAFSDRTAAQAAVRELEAKGYKPFIARGDQ